ncbi:MAG: CMP/dCMP kinase [Actinomycetota bacterium]|jgi:cytidylate kinase|nr:CMP/dCMP kinase [Actinomycetota bacterium]
MPADEVGPNGEPPASAAGAAGFVASTLVIAIDGPAGSGKSTVARGVAQRLGLRYLDTGAAYRALTWWVLHESVDPSDAAGVLDATDRFALRLSTDPRQPGVTVGDTDVTAAVRAQDVTSAVSAVSAIPEVRRRLVELQRGLVGRGGIVVEGRDIGTTVCPDAQVKVFLTASADARAARRSAEHSADDPKLLAGGAVAEVRADLDRRDRLDSSRPTSPLMQAPDAVVLDSTDIDAGAVIARVLALVAERTGVTVLPSESEDVQDVETFDSIGGERR